MHQSAGLIGGGGPWADRLRQAVHRPDRAPPGPPAAPSAGSVRLRSAKPEDPPCIDAPLLRHDDDVARMVEATLEARRLSQTPPLAGFVRGPEFAPGPAIDDGDVAGLARSITSRVESYNHPTGTCAMGPDPQSGAVVDAQGASKHDVGGGRLDGLGAGAGRAGPGRSRSCRAAKSTWPCAPDHQLTVYL